VQIAVFSRQDWSLISGIATHTNVEFCSHGWVRLSATYNVNNKNIYFEVGETLNITEGPFESFSGVVEEFDSEKQKIKISVLIFGRATSVELNVNQVEKIS
jgi:transcription antitermination factor NusG